MKIGRLRFSYDSAFGLENHDDVVGRLSYCIYVAQAANALYVFKDRVFGLFDKRIPFSDGTALAWHL